LTVQRVHEAPRAPAVPDEPRRDALGRFLRERREALAPERCGIASHRGRRTPGLRREEVAFLADIGVKWYARLEAGDDVRPSAATLTGIAVALRLSNAELEYMLDLAGLRERFVNDWDTTLPEPLRALVASVREVAITVGDRILTPLLWNDLADALYGFSQYTNAVERNSLVRSFRDPEFIEFLGPDREELVFRAVGMFRLNYSSPSPSAFAAQVYEKIKDDPLFQRAWAHRVIAAHLTNSEVTVRHHKRVGKLAVYAVDLTTTIRGDYLTRILAPADGESAKKFECLRAIGEANSSASKAGLKGCN
jgi:transcriptional regulator with XRE-family HTH domain